jgi:hypothetical protein
LRVIKTTTSSSLRMYFSSGGGCCFSEKKENKRKRRTSGRRAQEQLKISSPAVDGLFLSALSPLCWCRAAVSSSLFCPLSHSQSAPQCVRCIEGMRVDKSYIFNFSFSITFALDLLPLGQDYRQMHSLAQTVLTSYIMNGRRMSTQERRTLPLHSSF